MGSHLKQSLPRFQSSNLRSIQSLTFHSNKQHSLSPFNHSSYHQHKLSYFHPLQHFNHRTFARTQLPEHEVVGLPALSPSVEESKIVSWKVKEGEMIEADGAIAVIQTDKAELDWQVTDDVYLAKILLQPGEQVPVGTPCCIFVEEQKDVAAFKDYVQSCDAQVCLC